LKAYQIKDVISQFLENNPKNKFAYRSKNKKDLIQILKNFNINPRMYQIIQKNPYVPLPRDILKKYGKTAYKGDQQDEYLNELNMNERYKNPLQALNKYTNREGNQEYINILNHQKKFITQFCYSNLRGSIAFHGVGSGKTLTAVVASYLYLKIYPNNKVIVISPSSLLFNFINGMQQYGLDISDNRYSFLTYDKYVRKPVVAKNALLIVDEAHNFRTAMKIETVKDPETNEILGETAQQNKKGFAVLKYGAMFAHKVILLTGTAFVNSLYDIENLLAMVDERMPIDIGTFSDSVINNPDTIEDYFSYRISYYPSQKNEFFPEMIEKNIVLYMTPEQYSQYLTIKQEGIPHKQERETETNNPNAFFSAERYASNKIKDNPKIKFIVDRIRKKKNDKFIIYSSLYDAGVQILMKKLDKLNIKWVSISGQESVIQKENSKLYYNYYNFNNDKFFDMKTVPANYQKYINNEYRVLLITRAGAEGVDTTNTQNIILLDSQWNDALTEQIIARAVRFKSHFQLPEEQRFVNVYRLFLCSEEEKELVDRIMQPDFNDWGELRGEMRDTVREQLKLKQIDNEVYIPLLKELKELKNAKEELFIKDKTEIIIDNNGNNYKIFGFDEYKKLKTEDERKKWRTNIYNLWHTAYGSKDKNIKPTYELLKQLKTRNDKPYIPDKTTEIKRKGQIGKKWNIIRTEGWDFYEGLHKDDKQDWINKKYSEWLSYYKPTETERKVISGQTVDINMYILAKSKTKAINDFIKNFGTNIKLFESYQSQLLKYVVEDEKKLKRQLTDEEQANIYVKVLKEHPIEKLPTFDYLYVKQRLDKQPNDKSKIINTQKNVEFQQYYTNYELAKYIINKTNLKSVKDKVEILEPTAGEGYLIKPIYDMKIDYNLDLIELDKENRKKLDEIAKSSLGNINLLTQANFLLSTQSKRYDYIFMNPPFHIKKSTNAIIKRDIWDFDFVKRAFAMLKIGGQLVAITSKHFMFASDEKSKNFRDWLKINYDDKKLKIYDNNILEVDIEEREQEKFENENRKMKMDVMIIHITKKSDIMDSDILNEKYYDIEEMREIGNDIINNITTLDKENIKDLNKANDEINKITVKAEEPPPVKVKNNDNLDILKIIKNNKLMTLKQYEKKREQLNLPEIEDLLKMYNKNAYDELLGDINIMIKKPIETLNEYTTKEPVKSEILELKEEPKVMTIEDKFIDYGLKTKKLQEELKENEDKYKPLIIEKARKILDERKKKGEKMNQAKYNRIVANVEKEYPEYKKIFFDLHRNAEELQYELNDIIREMKNKNEADRLIKIFKKTAGI